MIKLVIFDFDGTIVDTAADLVNATNEFRTHYGYQALPELEIRAGIGTGLKELLYNTTQSKDEDFSKIESHFIEIYERHHLLQAKAFDGLEEFLKNWPHKVAILSNKTERFIHSILKHLKLDEIDWVDVIGGDTFEHKKPHPLPFENLLRLANVSKEEALMVGDGEPDILGAKNAGISSVAVEYGYCSFERLMSLGAHHSIRHLSELLPLIHSLTSRFKP